MEGAFSGVVFFCWVISGVTKRQLACLSRNDLLFFLCYKIERRSGFGWVASFRFWGLVGLGRLRESQGKVRSSTSDVGSLTSSVRQATHARKTGEFLPCLKSIAKIARLIKYYLTGMVNLLKNSPVFSGSVVAQIRHLTGFSLYGTYRPPFFYRGGGRGEDTGRESGALGYSFPSESLKYLRYASGASLAFFRGLPAFLILFGIGGVSKPSFSALCLIL